MLQNACYEALNSAAMPSYIGTIIELELALAHIVECSALNSLHLLFDFKSLVLLLISNLTNELHLHQILMSKTTVANTSLKSDANGDH